MKFLVFFKIVLQKKQKIMCVIKKRKSFLERKLSVLGESFLVPLLHLPKVPISAVCTEFRFLVVSTETFFNIG